MEHTFFQPRVNLEKRTAPAEVDVPASDLRFGAEGHATAEVHSIAFQPREMLALSQLDVVGPESEAGAITSFQLRIGDTPAAFTHLYANLERIANRVSDMSIVTGNLLETERPYVLGVTSAIAGEGKTTVALHMALTIARSTAKRVCFVDLSLGDNDLAARLGMPSTGDGLISAIDDTVDVVPCFKISGCDNLTVVPAGRRPRNPARFVRTPRIAQFLIATRHAFDVVIVDMPAVSTENALPIARQADGTLMVVRAGVTPREVVADALEAIGTDRINCVVLNRVKPSAPKWLQKRYARV